MAADQGKDWRKLCEAVVMEKDPDRFMALVIELNNALDENDRRRSDVFRDESDAFRSENNLFRDEHDRMPRSSATEYAW